MYIVEDGKVIEEYDEFINIGETLPEGIIEITGITDKMLAEEGVSEKKVADDLKQRLTKNTLMIAYNTQFDLSFIYTLLKRHYPDDAKRIVSGIKWIDTLTVLKDRKAYPHKLCDAVDYYNIEKVNFHRAIDDTKALVNVTQALKNERNDLKEYINIFGYNPKYGVDGVKFPFITYKKQNFHNGMAAPWNILPRK